ncbi:MULTISPECIES: STAS domain-containing protein [Aneurinibacillus]|uniref:Anti-anti-sigma factor n=1 Tax=Aneurinibacillus thermoaerophilus TaxID=143495 RepID=A0A1G7XTW3_ANETH|nr:MULTISPECIES: STAS domain-containing protein [Aneurinibacillus]MED0677096.1 STAS domain-containing protein [Aneurinibacillus thermoaerophilus]MED0679444.1 STAS domain-containing protein [Aneurinibacillus thermoaerophilus]MED0737984.1 STAS domain-containing protein [Aneurinibacillus thermoaerophilus]MED0756406.1 STAS domain-containing protein [Aneurinibacillus thermoaerophilus]MED0761195.1 STAS domain-containing protein [Aneurinibacillus thermoaerophilus]
MIDYKVQENQVVFIFQEDIHFETVRQMEEKVKEVELPEYPNQLIIDLRQVRCIDSTGIGFLISWIHPLLSHYEVKMINSSLPVKRILQICKLDTLIEIA